MAKKQNATPKVADFVRELTNLSRKYGVWFIDEPDIHLDIDMRSFAYELDGGKLCLIAPKPARTG